MNQPTVAKVWSCPTAVAAWTVISDQDDVVLASGFCDAQPLVARLQALSSISVEADEPPSTLRKVVEQFLAGDADALNSVEVRQPGTVFRQHVWQTMREIPAGSTWSYTELAVKAGRPAATRAVGSACATNLIAPFVPCHRVVRSDGSLGGYAYGLDVKRWLLDAERRAASHER